MKRKRTAASSKGGAFSKAIMEKALEARQALAQRSAPFAVTPFDADEQIQMVLQFNWEELTRILQDDSMLLSGDNLLIRWSS